MSNDTKTMDESLVCEELACRMALYFAQQLGQGPEHLAAVLDGHIPITPDLAARLASVFSDTSPGYWMELQKRDDAARMRANSEPMY